MADSQNDDVMSNEWLAASRLQSASQGEKVTQQLACHNFDHVLHAIVIQVLVL